MTIAYYIASPSWGGGEQYVYDLALHLRDRYQVTSVFLFPPHSDPAMVHRFQEIGICPPFRYSGKLWRFSRFGAWRLARLLDRLQVDILHLNSRQSYIQAALAKQLTQRPVRIIASQHLVRQAKVTPIWRWAYRRIDTLICTSQCVHHTYLSSLQDPSVFRDIRIVHNSVPIDNADISCSQQTTPPIFFYHGRICQEKGVFEWLQALEQISDLPWQAVIAGSVAAPDKESWENALAHSPIQKRITCLGFRTDIMQLIPRYQIGVIPTLPPEAGGPLALLADMAFGMPVITSDNGSQTEFIRHEENGLLCPPGDITALSRAMRRLLTDRDLATRLGQQARTDFFRQHTYEQFVQTMYNLYTER